jgi:uncharacterized membrane protein HdeD (DUF308 family)
MLSRRFAMLLGVFLIIEGCWGLFSPIVFGVLSTNKLHAVIHIVLGIVGILAGRSGAARNYLLGVGALLVVVGILRFVPGASDLVVSLLNVNFAVAYFNIAVGLISLAIGFSAPKGDSALSPTG